MIRGESSRYRRELTEASRDQLDPMAHGEQEPFSRTEESAPIADPRFGEDVIEVEQEGAAENEVLPVVTRAQRGQERVGIGGT